MLLESLDEFLHAAEYCIRYTKGSDAGKWLPPHSKSGVLGFPASSLMFSIVDVIGSYHDGLKVNIGDEIKAISNKKGKAYTHFYILNSSFFGLNLSEDQIKNIYLHARSAIVHNAAIGNEITLVKSNSSPFIKVRDFSGKGKYEVHLLSFYKACSEATNLFKKDLDKILSCSKLANRLEIK